MAPYHVMARRYESAVCSGGGGRTLFNGIDAANARIVDRRRENDCSVLEGVEGGRDG